MTLREQALQMVYILELTVSYEEEEYIECELRKAFEAGQRAALETSGQQTRMEINSYMETA